MDYLDDYCLCHIFQQLSIRDQLSISKASQRFRDVIVGMIWRKQFRELRTIGPETDALSNEEYQEFFPLVADCVEKFIISDTKHLTFTSYLGRYMRRPELSFYFSFDFPRLRVLECLDRLHDGYMRLIAEKFPKLQVLRVSSSYITGSYIKDMRNLRELYAPKCGGLQAIHLRDIFHQLNLTHLDVTGAETCDSEVFTDGVANRKLRHLSVSESSVDEKFAKNVENLRTLRSLRVCDLWEEPKYNANWLSFLEGVGPFIKELQIFYTNSHASMKRVLPVALPHLSNLEILHLGPAFRFPRSNSYQGLRGITDLYLYGPGCLDDVVRLLDCWLLLKRIFINFEHDDSSVSRWFYEVLTCLQKQTDQAQLAVYVNESMFKILIEFDSYRKQNAVKLEILKQCKSNKPISDISYVEFGFK